MVKNLLIWPKLWSKTPKAMQFFLEAGGNTASQSAYSQFLDAQFITLKRTKS